MMLGLTKKLKAWQEQGFISLSQFEAILLFENKNKKSINYFLPFWFLAIFSIVLGLIAVISANWYEISSLTKIISAQLIFIFFGVGVLWSHYKQKEKIQDVPILGFFLFSFAMQGLVAQIYNLSGELYQVILSICLANLPLVFFTRRFFVSWVWSSLFLFGLLLAFESSFKQVYFHDAAIFFSYALLFVFVAIMTPLLSQWHFLKRFKAPFLVCFFSYPILLSLIPLSGHFVKVPMNFFHTVLFFTGILLSTILFTVLHCRRRQQKIFFVIFMLSTLILFFFLGVFWPRFLSPLFLSRFVYQTIVLVASIFCLFSTGLLVLTFKREKLFYFFIFLIGCRLLIFYTDVAGSLNQTGLALVLFGVLSLLFSIVIYFFRDRLLLWSKKITKMSS